MVKNPISCIPFIVRLQCSNFVPYRNFYRQFQGASLCLKGCLKILQIQWLDFSNQRVCYLMRSKVLRRRVEPECTPGPSRYGTTKCKQFRDLPNLEAKVRRKNKYTFEISVGIFCGQFQNWARRVLANQRIEVNLLFFINLGVLGWGL